MQRQVLITDLQRNVKQLERRINNNDNNNNNNNNNNKLYLRVK